MTVLGQAILRVVPSSRDDSAALELYRPILNPT